MATVADRVIQLGLDTSVQTLPDVIHAEKARRATRLRDRLDLAECEGERPTGCRSRPGKPAAAALTSSERRRDRFGDRRQQSGPVRLCSGRG